MYEKISLLFSKNVSTLFLISRIRWPYDFAWIMLSRKGWRIHVIETNTRSFLYRITSPHSQEDLFLSLCELVDAEESFTFALATLFLKSSPGMRKQRRSTTPAIHGSSVDPLHLLPSPFCLSRRSSIWSARCILLLPSLSRSRSPPASRHLTLDWIFHSTLYQTDARWISIHRGAAIPAVWYPRHHGLGAMIALSRLLAVLFHEESCEFQRRIRTL